MVSRIDRNQVVDTALRLLNEVGLDGLTLRRIAKELNVQAPALYWHFKNKQELLDEMATAMLRRMTSPLLGPEPGGRASAGSWQDALSDACRVMRRGLLGYRDGGKVFSGTRMTDESYAMPLDALLRLLTTAGFSANQAARAWWTAYNFTVGVVIEEQSVYPEPGDPADRRPESRDPAYDLASRSERIGEQYPLAMAAGDEMFGDLERSFEEGLRIIVAGVAATTGR
ncbi:TetR/AcrR family transcriptional regulator C-terminal domain-containing protein [Streptomyces kronopolitis]|uniref:TetR/AcrR family transcriptional regulator C-terminal domain-containing protein n=1 Tax=Streptomyces kronopolitis TaxID=1612435 RepID=UPI00341222FC